MHFHLRTFFTIALASFAVALPASSTNAESNAPELKGKRSFVERNGVKRTIFEHEATGATLDFVTNSGICETTPGVNQYSGYLSVGSEYNPASIEAQETKLTFRQRKYVVLVLRSAE
jgi:hypothetical protein